MDDYWYTAITASIKDGVFSTSVFEEGVGVYHHILGIIPAAVLAGFTEIPTHIALWGIMIPFGMFAALFAVEELLLFFIPGIKKDHKWAAIFLIIFCLLIPLNPKNLLKFQFDNALWNTDPFTMPSIPNWNMVYVLSTLIFIYLFEGMLRKWKDGIFFILLLSLILLTKTPSFFNILLICGFYTLIIWIKKGAFRPLMFVTLSIIPVFLIVKLFYGNGAAGFSPSFGFLPYYFSELLHITGSNVKKLLFGYGSFFVTIIIWLNLRIFGLFSLPRNQSDFYRNYFLLALFATLICDIILSSSFRIYSFLPNGKPIEELSYDLMQFFRSYFIYITIFAPIGLVLFFRQKTRPFSYKILATTTGAWIILCLLLVIYSNYFIDKFDRYNKPKSESELSSTWAKEVVPELKRTKFRKLVMKSDMDYSGQYLSAFDIGPWYLSVKNREGGYTMSYKNYDKYLKLDSMLLAKDVIDEVFYHDLTVDGVDVFVATPVTIASLENLSEKGYFKKVEGTKWLFNFIK